MNEFVRLLKMDIAFAPTGSKSLKDTTCFNATIGFYPDHSSIGYIHSAGKITHLLFGEYYPECGLSLKSINLENLPEGILCFDAMTDIMEAPITCYNGKLDIISGERKTIGDVQIIEFYDYDTDPSSFADNFESKLIDLSTLQPEYLDFINKTLSEASKLENVFIKNKALKDRPIPEFFEERLDRYYDNLYNGYYE